MGLCIWAEGCIDNYSARYSEGGVPRPDVVGASGQNDSVRRQRELRRDEISRVDAGDGIFATRMHTLLRRWMIPIVAIGDRHVFSPMSTISVS